MNSDDKNKIDPPLQDTIAMEQKPLIQNLSPKNDANSKLENSVPGSDMGEQVPSGVVKMDEMDVPKVEEVGVPEKGPIVDQLVTDQSAPEKGISSSQSEPRIIPESQDCLDFSSSTQDEKDVRSSGAENIKNFDSLDGASKVTDVQSKPDINLETYEVTVDRGVVQLSIQDDNEGQCQMVHTANEVINDLVKQVDDKLAERIHSLEERTSKIEERTAKLSETSGHNLRETPSTVEVPMDVDLLPSGGDKGGENKGEKNTKMETVNGEGNTDGVIKGVSADGKLEEADDEAWKSEDFDIPPSDDEAEFMSEPPPHVIVELYQKLERETVLDLEWTCLGRRTPDEDPEMMVVEESEKDDKEEEVDEPVVEDLDKFDFDIDTVIQNQVTPRRIPGFDPKGSGSAKKRVAKMDKVLDDIRRFSKINEEMEKTGDTAPPTPADLEVTPQRPLGKFHIRRDLHQ